MFYGGMKIRVFKAAGLKPVGWCLMAFLLVVLLSANSSAASRAAAGTTLTANVTADANYVREYSWEIDKSVTPDTWNISRGDSATSEYTINVNRTGYTDRAWIEGNVTVCNGGEVATENLTVLLELRDGLPPPNDLIGTYTLDLSSNPVLDPGEVGVYPYRIDLTPEQVHAGGTYKVTANVKITNHSGHLGTPFGPSPSATTILPGTLTPLYECINVDDTNGGSWMFSDSGSVKYNVTFTENGTYVNTATIMETGQSANATVTVVIQASPVAPLTIGYWKTHAGFNGNNDDVVTELLGTGIWLGTPGGEDSILVTTAEQAFRILQFNGAASNGINKLYAQLLAAKLNILNGAYASDEVLDMISDADEFLATHDASSWTSITKPEKQEVLSWMSMLDKYNNGML